MADWTSYSLQLCPERHRDHPLDRQSTTISHGSHRLIHIPCRQYTADVLAVELSGMPAGIQLRRRHRGRELVHRLRFGFNDQMTIPTNSSSPNIFSNWFIRNEYIGSNFGSVRWYWMMFLRITSHPVSQTVRLTIQEIGENQFRVSSFGTPGQSYTLQFTTDLRSIWQTLTNVTPDTSGTWTLDPHSERQFVDFIAGRIFDGASAIGFTLQPLFDLVKKRVPRSGQMLCIYAAPFRIEIFRDQAAMAMMWQVFAAKKASVSERFHIDSCFDSPLFH